MSDFLEWLAVFGCGTASGWMLSQRFGFDIHKVQARMLGDHLVQASKNWGDCLIALRHAALHIKAVDETCVCGAAAKVEASLKPHLPEVLQ